MRPGFRRVLPVVCMVLAGTGLWQEGRCATMNVNSLLVQSGAGPGTVESGIAAADRPPSFSPAQSAALAETSGAGLSVEEPEIRQFYDELFQRAWQFAPELQAALAKKRQKDAERFTARARRLAPEVTGELSGVHEIDMEGETSGGDGAAEATAGEGDLDGPDYGDWNLSLRLPLLNRESSLRMAEAGLNAEVAGNQLDITTQELDIQLREALAKYLVARYRLLNLTNSVTLAREHVGRINRGFELRDQTRLQLLQAQANLQELEARRDLNVQNSDSALLDLLNLGGLSGDDPLLDRLRSLTEDEQQTAGCINSLLELEPSFRHVSHFVDSASDQELRDSFQGNSLLYRRIDLNLQLAMAQAGQYTQDNWPELAVTGDYGRKEDTGFSEYEGKGSLALVLSVPLFTGGTAFSNTRAKAMAEEVARVNQDNTLRRTVHLITSHRSLIQSLRKVYATQLTYLEQQQEIVRLSLKSYDIKQTSMQDLLTAFNRLIDAKNALMETTATLGTLYRQFAWELGTPFPSPPAPAAGTASH